VRGQAWAGGTGVVIGFRFSGFRFSGFRFSGFRFSGFR
jgi:hypothetical protein